jgi:hypothetical protein
MVIDVEMSMSLEGTKLIRLDGREGEKSCCPISVG